MPQCPIAGDATVWIEHKVCVLVYKCLPEAAPRCSSSPRWSHRYLHLWVGDIFVSQHMVLAVPRSRTTGWPKKLRCLWSSWPCGTHCRRPCVTSRRHWLSSVRCWRPWCYAELMKHYYSASMTVYLLTNVYVWLVGPRRPVSECWGRWLEIFLLTYLLHEVKEAAAYGRQVAGMPRIDGRKII